VEKEPWWKSLVKYFLHGLAFSVIFLLLALVWAFILAILVVTGLVIGLIIGLILLLFIIGGLNSFLTDFIWSIPIKTGWKSLLGHGFVLFIALIIVHVPAIMMSSIVPKLSYHNSAFHCLCSHRRLRSQKCSYLLGRRKRKRSPGNEKSRFLTSAVRGYKAYC